MLYAILFNYAQKSSSVDSILTLVLIILFFSLSPIKKSISQISNSTPNTIYKIKASNPSDISTVLDNDGGIYFFWKEGRSTIESKVYYVYLDYKKKLSREISGENISHLSIIQNYPKAISYISKEAILAWKDYSNLPTGELYLQRFAKDKQLWNKPGVKINNSSEQIFDYSLSSDKAGNIFVSYLSRSEFPSNNYEIKYQRLLSNGNLVNKEKILVESSSRLKSKLKIISDNNGGAYILWTENLNGDEVLLIKKVDVAGKMVFGKRPLKISGTLQSVKNFSADIINKNLLYVAWETKDNNIYHQLINSVGKAIWTVGGAKAAFTKGTNYLPKVFRSDTLITLGWLNSNSKRNSICFQKFKTNGKEVWTNKAVTAVSLEDIIENYTMTDDLEGGISIVYFSRSKNSKSCTLGIQCLNNKGKLLLDSAYYFGSSKLYCSSSYLNNFVIDKTTELISYQNSIGEIIIESVTKPVKPEDGNINLTAQLQGKAVKLSINTNLTNENLLIAVERQQHSDTSLSIWKLIAEINSASKSADAEFYYTDIPDEYGTLYYRAILKGNDKELVSNTIRIDYLEATSKIVVAQNNPNPFSDSTTISFYLPNSSAVTFEFFNDHLEKIKEYPTQEFPAGENSIIFYRKDLQPGIYFYKLISKDFVEVKKMVID